MALTLSVAAGFAFFYSTKPLHAHFDYTFRIAQALLEGHVGLKEHPGSWLNELVPWKNRFYSVFPLGAVLTQIPVAILKKMALIRYWPAQETVSVVAAGCVYFCYRLTFVTRMSRARRILIALFPVFATFTWTNLGFAGAWQLALGFSMLGQSAALYFTLVRPKPILAGAFFALAFGNRVELVLVTPIFMYFWLFRVRPVLAATQTVPALDPAASSPPAEADPEAAPTESIYVPAESPEVLPAEPIADPWPSAASAPDPAPLDPSVPELIADTPTSVPSADLDPKTSPDWRPVADLPSTADSPTTAPATPPHPATPWHERHRPALIRTAKFLVIPALMLMAMAAYNYSRFHSVTDFGYARIPGVLNEPWYRHGLFSFYSIPWNIHKMLFDGAADMPVFPYIRFYPFGCSIFVASPFLFLLFREGGKHRAACWLAIAGLTMVLWLHGNPGGWQFSYRYAMIMLPWMFLLIVENGPRRFTATEASLFLASAALNFLAVYEFLWANMVHP